MPKNEQLEQRIKEDGKDGIITCASLSAIAEETGTNYREAGQTADRLMIKIKKCDLGCF